MSEASTTCSSCGGTHPVATETCPVAGTPVVNGGPCGTRVDRYEVQRWLGGGGMGAVYRARHAMMGQTVAIKLLHPRFAHDAGILERFLREARAAASIASPHIVKMFDFGMTPEGTAFLAMELLEGESLEAMMESRGAVSYARAIDIALQMLDGLGAAHAAGIVHRDMKPANVFLTRPADGHGADRELVKLVDFGISKVVDNERAASLTRTGMVLGTPYYMAPEQFENAREVDHRADLYATAVILYQMLSGSLPFRATSYQELLARVLTESPQPLANTAPSVPRGLALVVDRGLARAREARWSSAQEFASALRQSLADVLPVTNSGSIQTDPRAYFAAANTGPVPPHSGHGLSPTLTPVSDPRLPYTQHAALQQTNAPHFAQQHSTPAHHAAAAMQPATNVGAQAWGPGTPVSGPVPVRARSRSRRWVIGLVLLVFVLGGVGGGVWWYVNVEHETAESVSGGKAAVASPNIATAADPGVNALVIPGVNAPAQMAPVVTQEQPAEEPAQPEPTQAAASGTQVTIGDIETTSDADEDVVRAAMERARPRLEACRQVGHSEAVNIFAMVQASGAIPIARPATEEPGDATVARCVAQAFRAMAPLHGTGFGTVTIGVNLPAR